MFFRICRKPFQAVRSLVWTQQGAGAGLAVCALVVSAAFASASTYFLRDKATSFYLDSNGSGQAYTLPFNGGAYQKWVLVPVTGSPGYYFIRDDATGFCLDSNGGGQVYTLPFNGGSHQQWKLKYAGSGYYFVQNKATSFYLDSNASGQVYTLPFNGGSYQQWNFKSTTP